MTAPRVVVFVTVLLASCDRVARIPALPPKPDARVTYELREKCAKDASEWFKREHGESDALGYTIQTNTGTMTMRS